MVINYKLEGDSPNYVFSMWFNLKMFTERRALLNRTVEHDFPIQGSTWKESSIPVSEPGVHRPKPDFYGILLLSCSN